MKQQDLCYWWVYIFSDVKSMIYSCSSCWRYRGDKLKLFSYLGKEIKYIVFFWGLRMTLDMICIVVDLMFAQSELGTREVFVWVGREAGTVLQRLKYFHFQWTFLLTGAQWCMVLKTYSPFCSSFQLIFLICGGDQAASLRDPAGGQCYLPHHCHSCRITPLGEEFPAFNSPGLGLLEKVAEND